MTFTRGMTTGTGTFAPCSSPRDVRVAVSVRPPLAVAVVRVVVLDDAGLSFVAFFCTAMPTIPRSCRNTVSALEGPRCSAKGLDTSPQEEIRTDLFPGQGHTEGKFGRFAPNAALVPSLGRGSAPVRRLVEAG